MFVNQKVTISSLSATGGLVPPEPCLKFDPDHQTALRRGEPVGDDFDSTGSMYGYKVCRHF